MIDPISFLAGGAAVVAGKIALAMLTSNPAPSSDVIVIEMMAKPPPPPPMMMPRKTKTKIFVPDMGAVLQRAVDGSPMGSPPARKVMSPSKSSSAPVVVTSDDLRRVRLREAGPPQKWEPAPVNTAEFCKNCLLQKAMLKSSPPPNNH